MDTATQKLQKCFLAVFPQLDSSAVPLASVDTVGAWDSVAHVTLLSLIGEEFAIDLDFEEFAGATSFDEILQRVRAVTS